MKPTTSQATRESRRHRRPGKSVYLDPAISEALGGCGSKILQDACWCWARHLERSTEEVAEQFSDSEWAFLAEAVWGSEGSFDPALDEPGKILAAWAKRWGRLPVAHPRLRRGPDHLASVVDRLTRLSWSQAWAVIWALRYRAAHDLPVDGAGWWRLAHRRDTALNCT